MTLSNGYEMNEKLMGTCHSDKILSDYISLLSDETLIILDEQNPYPKFVIEEIPFRVMVLKEIRKRKILQYEKTNNLVQGT